MAEICGGEGAALLNLTSLWQTDNPQVSECFSRTVLVLLPAILVITNLITTTGKASIQSIVFLRPYDPWKANFSPEMAQKSGLLPRRLK